MLSSCREECEKRRGHMGSIHSEDENTFVLDLVFCPSIDFSILILFHDNEGVLTLGSLPWSCLDWNRECLGGWVRMGLSKLWPR